MCVCVLFPYCVGKGIYANKYGFIGGVSYATMVATCCNQNKGTIDIVESFFEKFSGTGTQISIPGFDLFRRDRPRRRGGGVLIFARSTVGATVCPQLLSDDDRLELLWIQMTFHDRKMVIGALYHPPRPIYRETDLVKELERATGFILAEPDDALVILAGDFNQLPDTVLSQ